MSGWRDVWRDSKKKNKKEEEKKEQTRFSSRLQLRIGLPVRTVLCECSPTLILQQSANAANANPIL